MGRPWLFDLTAFFYGIMTAQPTWRSSCARLANYLPSPTTQSAATRVLDLGCGPGVSTIILAQAHPTGLFVGLDLAPRMLAEAQHYTTQAHLESRVRYVLADAANLPFADNCLDMVTGHSFLYLVPDRTRVVQEAFRVLRHGGRIASMEPRADASIVSLLPRWREVRYVISVSLWRPYSHLHGQFSEQTFSDLYGAAGFVQTKTETVLDGLGMIGSGVKP